MREGWTIRTIGEVALHLCDGSHNPPVGIDFSKYPMLSSKNIFFDSYDYSEPRYLTKEQFDIENKRTNVSDGDILLTIVGTIGRVCCIKEPFQPFTLQRSVAVIKPNKNIIISRYLMYCLCGLNAYFNKEAKGVAQKGIYLKQLSKISIPVPPLQEQERIVAELDLLTEIIDKQKQQLKELDTLAQSIFYDMFGNPVDNEKGWKTCRLESIIQVKGRVGWKGYKKEDLRDSGALAIGGGHLTNSGEIDLSEPVYLSMEKYEESPEIMIETGDLILVQRGTIGKVGLVRTDIGQATINPCVLILRPKTINNVYALHFFLNSNMQEHLKTLIRGVAQPMITQQQVNSLCVPIPPSERQEVFAQRIQAIESQKQSINRSLAESQKLFDYTMDKYFG